MIDTQTGDLLAVVRDALAVPYPGTTAGRTAYLELCRDRGDAARAALDHVLNTGDFDQAVAMVDQALAMYPVTYPTDARWSPRGMDAAVTA